MKVAIEGCLHGELDAVYSALGRLGGAVDLLLCCGDFQSLRNDADLDAMAVPQKYRALGCFWEYYCGRKRAPVLTIFIGGNHEASNYLLELFHGGWVCENIYFLGFAGVVNVGGLRIGGLSGIYDHKHYYLPHYERPPFSEDTKRSVYHVREVDVVRLSQLSSKLDVFLSHDWPTDIAFYGETERLLQRKAFLRREVHDHSLGSPAAAQLLATLKPKYWFAAHLHVKFPAIVTHTTTNSGTSTSSTSQSDPSTQQPQQEKAAADITRFLALDKCLPRRDYLQLLDFPDHVFDGTIQHDLEWLAIVQKTAFLLEGGDGRRRQPSAIDQSDPSLFVPTPAHIEYLRETLPSLEIPAANFVATAVGYPDWNRQAHSAPTCTKIITNNCCVYLY